MYTNLSGPAKSANQLRMAPQWAVQKAVVVQEDTLTRGLNWLGGPFQTRRPFHKMERCNSTPQRDSRSCGRCVRAQGNSRTCPSSFRHIIRFYPVFATVGGLGVAKSLTTPYRPQWNCVVQRGNKNLADVLIAMILEGNDEYDMKLSHITRYIRAVPDNSSGDIPNLSCWAERYAFLANWSVADWVLSKNPDRHILYNCQGLCNKPMRSWGTDRGTSRL